MVRPGWPERNRAARSFRQLRRFDHVINSDKVFGTHSGSAKDLLAAQALELVVNLDPVVEWGVKILNLLDQHVISSADKKSHIVAVLSHVESEGRSKVWIAKSP
jgi:hypothetical protein